MTAHVGVALGVGVGILGLRVGVGGLDVGVGSGEYSVLLVDVDVRSGDTETDIGVIVPVGLETVTRVAVPGSSGDEAVPGAGVFA